MARASDDERACRRRRPGVSKLVAAESTEASVVVAPSMALSSPAIVVSRSVEPGVRERRGVAVGGEHGLRLGRRARRRGPGASTTVSLKRGDRGGAVVADQVAGGDRHAVDRLQGGVGGAEGGSGLVEGAGHRHHASSPPRRGRSRPSRRSGCSLSVKIGDLAGRRGHRPRDRREVGRAPSRSSPEAASTLARIAGDLGLVLAADDALEVRTSLIDSVSRSGASSVSDCTTERSPGMTGTPLAPSRAAAASSGRRPADRDERDAGHALGLQLGGGALVDRRVGGDLDRAPGPARIRRRRGRATPPARPRAR